MDAMGVARNICLDPRLVPGGGSCEMAVSRSLADMASKLVRGAGGLSLPSIHCTLGLQSLGRVLEIELGKGQESWGR